jgi:RNA polymerase sigma-70 factor (ECF subfamily)
VIESIESIEAALARFRRDRGERSFRRLYRLVTPRLWGLALRLSGDRGRAEELVQETWLRAVRGLGGFEDRARFTTWSSGILVRCWWELRRDRSDHHDPWQEEEAIEPRERRIVERLDLERALLAVAPGYRAIVLLHDLYGHTHEEIARLLAIEVGTSKSQLARGRRALRSLLEAGEPGGSDTTDTDTTDSEAMA